MNVLDAWWRSVTGLGPVFELIFLAYLFTWAVMMRRGNHAVARTLAAHVALWGIIGTYVSLIASLRVDLTGDGLKRFQELLSFGPESSLAGLSLYLVMNLFQHLWKEEA